MAVVPASIRSDCSWSSSNLGRIRCWTMVFTTATAPGIPPTVFTFACDGKDPHSPQAWEALATPGSKACVAFLNAGGEYVERGPGPGGAESFCLSVSRTEWPGRPEGSEESEESEEYEESEKEDDFGFRGIDAEAAILTTPALDAQLRAAVAEGRAWLAGGRA